MTTMSDQPDSATYATEAPVIIDLGKHGRKSVKALRRGQGKLMADVSRCIQDLQAAGTVSANAQPVIIIVRQRRRSAVAWPLG